MPEGETPQKPKITITAPAGQCELVVFDCAFATFDSQSVLNAYKSVRDDTRAWLKKTIHPPETVSLTYKLLLTEDGEEYFLDVGRGFTLLHDVEGNIPKELIKPHQTYRFILRHVREALQCNFIEYYEANRCDFLRRSMRFYIRMSIFRDSITTTY